MRILSKALTFLFVLGCVTPLGIALAGETLPDPAVVADAEKRFAKAGLELGIKESFLRFFADGSVLLAPGPVDARKFYTDYKEKGRALAWQPVFATIARSGDLGV